ncbi:MAG: tRNA (adenosine(37)-N6)-threonylcarbamoyltransferase complex ATPase subunit type 1 TsaE [Chloroflexi bacterium]|nr:tRNA (adenosine(37)-N6)-threonylcarbamoyltransferase complex ATPase subunit type 1 TsaE [Chloroflexota bacterium]
MSVVLELTTHTPDETRAVGRALGERAVAGDIFLLTGGLGSGKTTLAQGIAWGLGVLEHARSPTFVVVAQYQGRLPMYHIDLYRIEAVEEALDLGLEEYLFGQGIAVVEWAERAARAFPAEHLLVYLEYLDEASRRLRLEPHGSHYMALVQAVAPDVKEYTT